MFSSKPIPPRSRPALFPLALAAALLALTVAPSSAQGPEDEHWFYDYPGPQPEPFVFAIQGNYLYMGGLFLANSTTPKNLARFDLLTEDWEALPGLSPELSGSVRAIHVADNGRIYFGGNFSNAAGTGSGEIVEFDPSTNTWSSLTDPNPTLVTVGQQHGPTAGNGEVRAIQKIGNFLYVGGDFTGPVGSPADERFIRRFDLVNRRWEKVGGGLDHNVRALAVLPDNTLLAGGTFTGLLSRWNGTAWSTFQGGVDSQPSGAGAVRAIEVTGDGTIFIGGDFERVGGNLTVSDVASFREGVGWNALGGGFDTQYIQSNGTTFAADGVYDLDSAGDGRVYAGGDFQANIGRTNDKLDHVALWDGSGTWQNLGSGVGTTGTQIVNCVAVGLHADLFVGGTFSEGWRNASSANTQFARWKSDRDFTGYVPGASDNTTGSIVPNGAQLEITLRTRIGTTYELQASGALQTWSTIGGTNFLATGGIEGLLITPPAGADERFYRYQAVNF